VGPAVGRNQSGIYGQAFARHEKEFKGNKEKVVSGIYGQAFARHEKEFKGNKEKVVKRRKALYQVSNMGRYPSIPHEYCFLAFIHSCQLYIAQVRHCYSPHLSYC